MCLSHRLVISPTEIVCFHANKSTGLRSCMTNMTLSEGISSLVLLILCTLPTKLVHGLCTPPIAGIYNED